MNYPKVINVKTMPNYHILITFETGEIKLFDVNPYIIGNWFGQLKDLKIFETVHPNGNSVEWNDGQDIAPQELYSLSKPI